MANIKCPFCHEWIFSDCENRFCTCACVTDDDYKNCNCFCHDEAREKDLVPLYSPKEKDYAKRNGKKIKGAGEQKVS